MSVPGSSSPLAPLAVVTRRVVVSQVLFTTGNVLSTGGFLYYFASEFAPTAAMLAALQALPELAASAGVFTRTAIRLLGGHKRTWITFLLLSRVAALGVPLVAFPQFRPPHASPLAVMAVCIALWYVCQGIATTAYIAWLTELAPGFRWGRFFARKNMAMLAVMLIVPVGASLVRARLLSTFSSTQETWSYAAIFATAGLLVIGSIAPLLSLPDPRATSAPRALPTRAMLSRIAADRSFRLLLAHAWWFSFFQGLTQAAFFKYQKDVLHIPITTYYLLSSLMLALQLPLTAWAGVLSDRYGDKRPLIAGVAVVSLAMCFWLTATPQTWWLLCGAYAVWGLFAIVNLCGQNLALRLAPPGDKALHFALFHQVGGLLAGIAGLIGGFALDALLSGATAIEFAGVSWGPFQILFAISFAGRLTAALWLLPIREPARTAP